MQRIGSMLAGLALTVLGVAGVAHGVSAGRANLMYFKAKYGPWQGQTDVVLAAADRAEALYPHNYLLAVLAGETAWYNRFDAAGTLREDRWDAAARWCAIGLAQNPLVSQLRMLDTRLAERRSPAEAARKWEAYVAWDCWEPFNHVVLAELYAKAGRYSEALESLALLEPFPESQAAARRAVDEAWRAEIAGMQRAADTAESETER